MEILARTMSRARLMKKTAPCKWQYHPRSDHHSKVACWGVMFDLMLASDLMREHAAEGRIAFGINHVLVDHTNGRRKNLDLVVCRPSITAASSGAKKAKTTATFAQLAMQFGLELTDDDMAALQALPTLTRRDVGSVLIALEAKAAMTEFGKARPRLYDELQSSHTVVHGDTDSAIAVGLALINSSSLFISPTKNPCIEWGAPEQESKHEQPRQLQLTIEKIRSLPRREAPGRPGFDAIAAVALECRNDGKSPVTLMTSVASGAVDDRDVLSYSTMINRTVGNYASRFPRA